MRDHHLIERSWITPHARTAPIRRKGRQYGNVTGHRPWRAAPGIPRASHEDVFRPFFTAGKQEGTGLGLAMARQ
jgi:hypothetical protein